jgi:hypothetical protein
VFLSWIGWRLRVGLLSSVFKNVRVIWVCRIMRVVCIGGGIGICCLFLLCICLLRFCGVLLKKCDCYYVDGVFCYCFADSFVCASGVCFDGCSLSSML